MRDMSWDNLVNAIKKAKAKAKIQGGSHLNW